VLIDTHCHINIIVKNKFDVLLNEIQLQHAQKIINEAKQYGVNHIVNVGTSVIESLNCITLAQNNKNNYSVVGIHPGDCTQNWQIDLKTIEKKIKKKKEYKIVGIGECGLDFHYRNINKQRQKDVFKAQIELALEHSLPLVIHTREAADETLTCLDEFKNEENLSGVFHCFSQDKSFADYALNELNFFIGIGGIVTYPKNDVLRSIVLKAGLENIVLETDAPFLPPQAIRGQKNHPKHIRTIAHYVAQLFNTDLQTVARKTTDNAKQLFFDI